jgi:hypothetical protein
MYFSAVELLDFPTLNAFKSSLHADRRNAQLHCANIVKDICLAKETRGHWQRLEQ